MTAAPLERAALSAWRRSQRAALSAARQALPAAVHREKSAAILRHIETGFPALATRLVGFYWPIRHEVDPLPLMKRHVAAGGGAALPAVVGRDAPLEFRAWRPGVAMATGAYDIPYPAVGPAVAPEILLVPLLGFDGAGFRLGYGAGYYDRTLARSGARPMTIGVGFELGRLETIRPQPHDIAMDAIVTEAGIFRRAAAP